jgi:DNA-binding MarR family transcriptional regulator
LGGRGHVPDGVQRLVATLVGLVVNTVEPQLDPLLADPTRLSIVALLASCEWAEFGYVRDAVQISDSALSKQVATLEKSGHLDINKGYVGRRPRTWVQLSPAGRELLESHLLALQRIVEHARAAGTANDRPGAPGPPSTGRPH